MARYMRLTLLVAGFYLLLASRTRMLVSKTYVSIFAISSFGRLRYGATLPR